MDLAAIQSALRERNIDAWLFYDHHHRDPIAYRVLGLPQGLMVTRRWFYLIPAQGDPVKLVHKIEAGHLDSLPGSKRQYSGWQELFDTLKSMLAPYRDIAMQYSPNNIVFTISLVDGGTIELLRGLGKNVVSSADLVAQFEATWSEEQIKTHFAARDSVDSIVAASFQEIGRRSRNGGTTEHAIQQWFMEAFRRENLLTDDPPTPAIPTMSREPIIQFPFAKAIWFCSTCGERRMLQERFITTSRGWAWSARRPPTAFVRCLRLCATPATPA
jgi:Xaa-Pro aminopeptidase